MAKNILKQLSRDVLDQALNEKVNVSEQAYYIISQFYDFKLDMDYTELIATLSSIDASDYGAIVPSLYYLIWSTPNFKKQIALIDNILSNANTLLQSILLHYIILNFKKISTDRRDKFYYYIKKTYTNVRLSYILEIEDESAKTFIFKLIDEKAAESNLKSVFEDWNDEVFVKFITSCKPYLFEQIQNIKISEKTIRKHIDACIHPRNKDILYQMFK